MAVPLLLVLTALPLFAYIAWVLVAAILGIYLCGYASRKLGVHDHKGIVWDEFVGLWVAMIAIPITWQSVVVGFIAFRFFDMLKPWPISWVDRKVHGGFGIMVDDVIAGAAAWFVLKLLFLYGVLV